MKNLSKYDLANYTKDGDTIDSSFLRMLKESPDKVDVEIPPSCQYRIDLLARYFFGNARLYWVFYVINSIVSMEELAAGRVLKTVTLTDFEHIYTRWRHSDGR